MNRKQARVLDQFKPGEWLGHLEIRRRYIDSIAADKEWGPVSIIISLFSEENAKEWYDLMTSGVSISEATSALVEKGYLRTRWKEEHTPEELEARGGRRARECQITEDGIRVRTTIMQPSNNSAPAAAT